MPHRDDAAYLPHHPGFEYRVERARRRRASRAPRLGRQEAAAGSRRRVAARRSRRSTSTRHPVGGAAHGQGRRGPQERGPLLVARGRGGRHQDACAATSSRGRASTAARSPSWATGGSAEPRTDDATTADAAIRWCMQRTWATIPAPRMNRDAPSARPGHHAEGEPMSLSAAPHHRVLADVVVPSRSRALAWATDAALVVAGTALVAVAAQIAIPFWPVPLTAQTFAVLLVGVALGPLRGAALARALPRDRRARPARVRAGHIRQPLRPHDRRLHHRIRRSGGAGRVARAPRVGPQGARHVRHLRLRQRRDLRVRTAVAVRLARPTSVRPSGRTRWATTR